MVSIFAFELSFLYVLQPWIKFPPRIISKFWFLEVREVVGRIKDVFAWLSAGVDRWLYSELKVFMKLMLMWVFIAGLYVNSFCYVSCISIFSFWVCMLLLSFHSIFLSKNFCDFWGVIFVDLDGRPSLRSSWLLMSGLNVQCSTTSFTSLIFLSICLYKCFSSIFFVPSRYRRSTGDFEAFIFLYYFFWKLVISPLIFLFLLSLRPDWLEMKDFLLELV